MIRVDVITYWLSLKYIVGYVCIGLRLSLIVYILVNWIFVYFFQVLLSNGVKRSNVIYKCYLMVNLTRELYSWIISFLCEWISANVCNVIQLMDLGEIRVEKHLVWDISGKYTRLTMILLYARACPFRSWLWITRRPIACAYTMTLESVTIPWVNKVMLCFMYIGFLAWTTGYWYFYGLLEWIPDFLSTNISSLKWSVI